MNDSEYKACIKELGLLEGEEVKLHYVCYREIAQTTWDGKPKKEMKKGLLVITNYNFIYMQQNGAWSSDYSQALRVPLEQIIGMSCGGHLVKHICFELGNSRHIFGIWKLCEENSDYCDDAQVIVQRIQELLNQVREDRRRLAQDTLAKVAVPQIIFCRYCGARNKAEQANCLNCGALLA